MDAAGWMAIDVVLSFLQMSRVELDSIVATNRKQRFQISGNRVRACQGHSASNPAMSLDALEASWREYRGEQTLWHGTTLAAVQLIAREGILPMTRTHVHCAQSLDAIAGKSSNAEVMVAISPSTLGKSQKVFVAPNGVVLVRYVPAEAIVGFEPQTKRARLQLKELRAHLHFPQVSAT
jgi:putative RNA 2'-phosphotransferase